MRRPGLLILAFCLCLILALGAMGWVSLTILRLDRSALLEENVRLALWRMDSTLGPLIAQETARPYFDYTSFVPIDRAYTRMFAEIGSGDVLVPSPLLGQFNPLIRLHFQINLDGTVASPQVPVGSMRPIALAYTTPESIAAAESFRTQIAPLVDRGEILPQLPAPRSNDRNAVVFPAGGFGGQLDQAQQVQEPLQQQAAGKGGAFQEAQAQRSLQELQARNASQTLANNYDFGQNRLNRKAFSDRVREGLMRPLWVKSELFLARRVSINDADYIQGCWLDWAEVRRSLLSQIQDLLPGASLLPVSAETEPSSFRRLASLPIELDPGSLGIDAAAASPLRVALYVAWGCAIVGSAALLALLIGALRLSQRRADFVSAVTHELRTPLTTVSMYAEMLQEGMLRDESQKTRYLSTLRTEAERLGHLVENVLAFSRIERGRAGMRIQELSLDELLASSRQRLIDRAAQAGMSIELDVSPGVDQQRVRADASAVEQILFNLVDNACKYAASSPQKRLAISAELHRKRLTIQVSDRGPGISARDRRRLFQPFSKSAADAAHSAPGVGLGLALSRRLARQMNGDLRLASASTGAAFLLELPLAAVP